MTNKPTTFGYLIPEFPSQTHILFWREIVALRSWGIPLALFSTRRPSPGACPHAFAKQAHEETRYLFPPRWLPATAALAGCRHRITEAVSYLCNLRESPIPERLRLLGLLPCAADLLDHCRTLGVSHLHVHSCADAAHLAALCQILGGPSYSMTLHGDLDVYGRDHAAKMKRATFVSAVTASLQAEILARAGLEKDRVPVIWMGVDTDRFFDSRERLYEANRLHLVTVARLNVTKGHVIGLECVRRLVDEGMDIHYTLAGEGPHRGMIEEDIRRLGLTDRVTLAGSISEDEVIRLLQAADVFLLTSFGLGESGPVAVKEAMACGLPVVCSIIGGTRDMVRHGVDGFLVEQKDVDGNIQALKILAMDPQKRQAMGQAARLWAEERFDYRVYVRQLLERLEKSLRNKTGNGCGMIERRATECS